ncbi:MAG TPA: fibronectin type III domain-containing protein [Candidatus Angelobacter sp.]
MRLPLIFLCVAAAIVIGGCGTPGAPRPPSLGIPEPVSDLQAVRKGDDVRLTWTNPTETTDGELVRKQGRMIVVRAATSGAGGETVAELPLKPALKDESGEKGAATDSLAAVLSATPANNFVFYTVDAISHRGVSAGPSNQVAVPLVNTLPAPADLRAALVARGVSLSWHAAAQPQGPQRLNSQFRYRVMRRLEGTTDAVKAGEVGLGGESAVFIDTGIDWEKNYQYWITPITQWQLQGRKNEVEGRDSPIVAVFTHDTFPPAVPVGLQAVFSGLVQQPGIDLTWTPNSDEDLAGYNVYRRSAQGTLTKINKELVKTPAFHDGSVQPGGTYRFSVSAVDLRGNESARSAEAQEGVPKE